jgi:hypothetical protein
LTREGLTVASIEKRKGMLSANEYEHWIDKEKRLREGAEKAEYKADPDEVQRTWGDIVYRRETGQKQLTESEIISKYGKDRVAANFLVDKLREKKDPNREVDKKIVINNLKKDLDAGLYGEPNTPEAQLEYSKQVTALQQWMKENPDKEPSEYYEIVTKPVKEKFFFNLFNKEAINPKKQRESLGKEELPPAPKSEPVAKAPIVQPKTGFDKANLESQGKWVANNEKKVVDKLKGKPSGNYTFPGSNLIFHWDGKGGFTTSAPREMQ